MSDAEQFWRSRQGDKGFGQAVTLRGDALRSHMLSPEEASDAPGKPTSDGPSPGGATPSPRRPQVWLSQVEIRTHALRCTPMWASPQVAFHVFPPPDDGPQRPTARSFRQPSVGACWHSWCNPLHLEKRPSRALQVVRAPGPGVVVRPAVDAGAAKQGLAADLGAALSEHPDDAEFFPFHFNDDEDMDILECDFDPGPPQPSSVMKSTPATASSETRGGKKKRGGKVKPPIASNAAHNVATLEEPDQSDESALSSPWVLAPDLNALSVVDADGL